MICVSVIPPCHLRRGVYGRDFVCLCSQKKKKKREKMIEKNFFSGAE
jgi:hypothetical protein